MPRPEPVPFINYSAQNSRGSSIRNIDELNDAVRSTIELLVSSKMYTGVGQVQSTLFREYPAALSFVQNNRLHPNGIPAILNHQQLIQHVNAIAWGYAVVNPIVTLEDLNKLLKLEIRGLIRNLGPIYNLPVALELCGVYEFHRSVKNAFVLEDEASVFRPSTQVILDELNACICKKRHQAPTTSLRSLYRWWEAVFTRHMLIYFSDPCVSNDEENFNSCDFHFSLLGPYGIRIKGFSKLIESVIKALCPNGLLKASRNAELMMERSIKAIYQKFTDNVISNRAIAELRQQKPKAALRKLARNCRNLHNNLEAWAKENNLAWLPHYLDSLLSFADFLDSFARKGPLKSILHLVLTYCDSEAFNPEVMPPKLQEGVVVNVDTDAVSVIDSLGEDGVEMKRGKSLADVVNCFNDFYETFSNAITTESVDLQVPWQRLADLERQFNISSGKTLLTLLADASAEGFEGSKPKCLFIDGQLNGTQLQVQQSIEAEPQTSEVEAMTDVSRIWGFLRHLTYLTERSAEALMDMTIEHLNIPRSPSVLQSIRCILTDACVSPAKYHFLVHPQEWSFLSPRTVSSQMPSKLFTQRSVVLRLLASCPVLENPEDWSLWSLCPASLAAHWGPFDEFLADVAADTEICEKYNLAVIKVAGNGYIRLSTNGSPDDLDTNLSKCASAVNGEVGCTAARKLCDLLIGSILLVNRFILPNDCINIVSANLRSIPLQDVWHHFIRRIILATPLSLLGVLFSKVLLPALAKSFVLEEGGGLEDLLRSVTELRERDCIVTGIGVIGGQLGWLQWVDIFKTHRLSAAEYTDCTPSCRATKSLIFNSLERSHEIPLPSTETLSIAVTEPPSKDVIEFETSSMEGSATGEEQTECREFIENLRRTEFGLGIDLDAQASSLLRRLEGRLRRSLDHLSRKLYGQQGHFMLELIQNADDNVYASDVTPSVHFLLSPAVLMVLNNEAVGFSPADISALCDIGMSTKIGHREDKTGRKGIGFKSVFAVSDAPEVHSNGFHVRFHRCQKSDGTPISILTPEWIASPSSCNLEREWRTLFRLPLRPATQVSSACAESVLTFARHLLTHHLLLFLRRIDYIAFETSDLSINLDIRLERKSRLILTLGGPNPSSLKLLTITRVCNGCQQISKWLFLRHSVSVAVEMLKRLSGGLSELGAIPRQTDIAIAIPLSNEVPPSTFPLYAFLPIRSAGFQFLLNADFDLTSSREDVDESSVWNQYLVNQIPAAFESLINCVIKMSSFDGIPLTQYEILGRILECLPIKNRTSTTAMGIFACLGEKICEKLSSISWFPVLSEAKFSLPNKVLLSSQNLLQVNDSVAPETYLFRLLIDRLGMYELEQTFLVPLRIAANDEGVDVESIASLEQRMEKLFCLGARRISADTLIELASTLSAEELNRPGVLYVLLANIDSHLRSASSFHQQYHRTSLTDRAAWQRRCLRSLRGARLFPLLDGRLVSLEEIANAMADSSGLLRHRNSLMIPPKPPYSSKDQLKSVYGDYLQLLSRLGPLLSPSSIYPMDSTSLELPRLLTASDDGLGLIVANSSLDVINRWIVSRQLDFNLESIQDADWFIAAAQLIIHAGHLDEVLISRLPIVCEAAKSLKLFNPSADVAFLSPVFLKHVPDTEEHEIMSLCVETTAQNDLQEGRGGSILLASSNYFSSCGPSLELDGPEACSKWQSLFLIARLSTIQTLHLRKYRLGVAPAHLPPLPSTHTLKLSPALISLEGEGDTVIEDWTCPGLENLVLPWIEQTTERFGLNKPAKVVCEKLAILLSRNWDQSFERYALAVAYKVTDANGRGEMGSENKRVVLGASSWLQALRTRRWLAVTLAVNTDDGDGGLPELVAAADNYHSATAATNFVSTPPIYAPAVFTEGNGVAVPFPLFAPLCPLWQSFQTSEEPPAPGLLTALGVKQILDESIFQHLMDYLLKDPCNLPNTLTVETILQVYGLALQALGDTRSDILHRIFSSALLVPCSAAHTARKKRTKLVDDVDLDRQEEESATDCPFCMPQVKSQRRKRHSADTLSYHLVPACRTCWEEIRLPPLDHRVGVRAVKCDVEMEVDEDDECVQVPVPSMNPASVVAPCCSSFDRRVPLCDIYGPEWKSFFCGVLRVPLTSSLAEVLSKRPLPPSTPSDTKHGNWRTAQEAFGRRLAAWYALINRCLVAHSGTTSITAEEGDDLVATLRDFPLLYDMTGTWRVPSQVTCSPASTADPGLLFAWSAADLATMLPPTCLLGHGLEILRGDTELSTSERQSKPMSDSHFLLLNVLRLPVLEKSVTESVGLSEAQSIPGDEGSLLKFAVPSPFLNHLVKDFRLLTLTWLSSTNAHHHSADAAAAFTTTSTYSDDTLDAFLLPNLMVRLTLVQSISRPLGALKEWTFFDVACRFWEGKLYVDKRFEVDFAIGDDNDGTTSLLFEARRSICNVVLMELTRAVFPTNRSAQISLLHFARGLLSLRTSLLSSSLPRKEVTRQLHTYLLSHCIPRGSHCLANLIHRLVPVATSPVSPATISTPLMSTSPVVEARLDPIPSSQNRQEHMSVGCSTRFQTPIFAALASEHGSGPNVSTTSTFSVRSSFFGDNLLACSTGLDSILSCSAHSSSYQMDIGRMGEQSVYEIYLEQMRRNQDFNFPSGHPLLGSGRLVEVRWVNGDGESWLPYDLIIFLEVNGSMSTARMELSAEVRSSLVRQSTTSPNLLLVGPIYVEVKSTGVMEEEVRGEGRPDFFEISLAEAAFARTSSWRYHLVRVWWSRGASGDAQIPLEPRLLHIPNLSRALTDNPAHHRLYIGLKR